jgi:uncharacterized SAM-binding protein YcdF (DUF218 family)
MWLRYLKKSAQNFWICLVVCLIILGSLIYMLHETILLSIGNFLIIQDQPQTADVIHVVSGLDYRTLYAIQLYKQGYGKAFFFTGGWCAEIQGVHADRSRQLALEQGVPEDAVRSDSYQVTSTYQEAERLKLWMDQTDHAPVHSVIVVSDPHHMRRAQWAYRQVLGENITLIMLPVPFDQTPFSQRWWEDDASRTMLRDEYIKLVYYFARYKLSWGPLKDWLASLDTE